MDGKIEYRCSECGKLLDGVTLGYFHKWKCSKCAGDQTSALYCERGCKVEAVNLDAGWEQDAKQAHELLVVGHVYEVENLYVGAFQSRIQLKEFPGKTFNTAHFKRRR